MLCRKYVSINLVFYRDTTVPIKSYSSFACTKIYKQIYWFPKLLQKVKTQTIGMRILGIFVLSTLTSILTRVELSKRKGSVLCQFILSPELSPYIDRIPCFLAFKRYMNSCAMCNLMSFWKGLFPTLTEV